MKGEEVGDAVMVSVRGVFGANSSDYEQYSRSYRPRRHPQYSSAVVDKRNTHPKLPRGSLIDLHTSLHQLSDQQLLINALRAGELPDPATAYASALHSAHSGLIAEQSRTRTCCCTLRTYLKHCRA